jgi:hypothetical protein
MSPVASLILAQSEPPPPWSEAVREQMKHLTKTHGLIEQFCDWGWAFRLSCLAILISTLVVLWLALSGRLRSAGLGVSTALVPVFFGGLALLSAVLRYGARFTSGMNYALMTGHNDGIPQLGEALSLPYSFYLGSISSLLCLFVFCIRHLRARRRTASQ